METGIIGSEFRYSLRQRLLLLQGIAMLITLFVVAAVIYAFVYNVEQASWRGRQGEAVDAAQGRVEIFFQEALRTLAFLGLEDDDPAEDELLAEIIKTTPGYLEIILVEGDGNVVSEAHRDFALLAESDRADQETWYEQARSQGLYISRLLFDANDYPYLIVSTLTGLDRVAAARIDMQVLSQSLSLLHFGESGVAYLVESSGTILASSDLGNSLARSFFPYDAISRDDHIEEVQTLFYNNGSGTAVVGTISRNFVTFPDWHILSEINEAEAFQSSQLALRLLGGVFIIFWIITMLLTLRFSNQLIFQPLHRLQIGTEEIEKGNLNYQIKVAQSDEIGRVMYSFNTMTRQLLERSNVLNSRTDALIREVSERKQAESRLEALFKQTSTLYIIGQRLTQVYNEQDFLKTLLQEPLNPVVVSLFFAELGPDGEPLALELAASTNTNSIIPALPMGTRFEVDQIPFAQHWLSNASEPQLVSNVPQDERLDPNSRMIFQGLGIHATAVIPLNQGGRWIGVVSCLWSEAHPFSELEIAIYRALPALCSPVVENLRLVHSLEQSVRDLKVANRIAEENVRLKSEFLATMSHELRTPLNAIEGFTSIMLGNMGIDLDPQARKMMERISANSKRLLMLINDFLDLSRIESGRMELVNRPISPSAMVDRLQSEISVLAENKRLDFEIRVDPDLPQMLYSDEDALAKIILNLLSNAFKFTPAGKVWLELRCDENEWSIEVGDTGIGIPLHARDYIFEEFRQVDGSSKRQYGGTGLGLAIVNKLTRALGGTIQLKSDVGKGSVFIVTLPLHKQPVAG